MPAWSVHSLRAAELQLGSTVDRYIIYILICETIDLFFKRTAHLVSRCRHCNAEGRRRLNRSYHIRCTMNPKDGYNLADEFELSLKSWP